MIKPIELFPGALVKSKAKIPGIMEVLAVGHEKIVASSKYFYEEEYFLEEIKPIQLTPKIIEKLGFKEVRKRDDGPYRYYKRGRIEIWFCYGELDSIWSDRQVILNEPPRRKRTVHYLQRVFTEKTRARIDFGKLIK